MAKKKLTDWGSLSGDLEKDRKKKEEQKPKTQTSQIGTGINNDWSLLTGDSKTDRSNIAKRQEEYKKSASAYQAQLDSINRTSKRSQVMMQGFHSDPVKQAQSEAEYHAKELARNAPIYQQISKEARKFSDYGTFNAAQSGLRQSSGNFADSYERYQQASQKAREDYLANLKQTNKSQYYGETLNREQIEGQIRMLERQRDEIEPQVREAEKAWGGAEQTIIDGKYTDAELLYKGRSKRLQEIEDELATYQSALGYRMGTEADEIRQKYAPDGRLTAEAAAKRAAGEKKYQADKQASVTAADVYLNNNFNMDTDHPFGAPTNTARRDALLENGYVSDLEDARHLSKEDQDIFYALYADDPEKAREWIHITKTNRDEQYQRYLSRLVDLRSGNTLWDTGAVFGGWLAGTGANIAAGVTNLVDPFSETALELSRTGQALLAGGAQMLNREIGTIDENIPFIGNILGGKGLGDLYTLASSMAESQISAVASAGAGKLSEAVQALGVVIMGSSAAAADYDEMLKRGLTEQQARQHAFAAGINEAAFEWLSLDKLVNPDFGASAIKQWLTQSGIEASEEFCTTIANRLTDGILARRDGYDTQIEQRMKELIALGVDHEAAKEQAEHEWTTDLINDALGGFISGGGNMVMNQALGYSLSKFGEVGERLQAQRNASAQFERQGAMLRQSNQTAALAQYAKDNNLTWTEAEQRAEAVNQSESGTGETDSSTALRSAQNDVSQSTLGQQVAEAGEQQKTRKEAKQQARQNRAIGIDAYRVQEHIQERLAGKTVQEQQAIRDELVQKYGSGMELPVYRAISMETAKQAAKLDSTDAIRQARETVLAEIQDDDMKRAVAEGYDQAAYQMAAQSNDLNAAAKYIQQIRNTGSGGMSMTATVTGEDGQSRQVKIADMTEDGKGVKLEDGTVVAAKDLVADADTMDVVKQLSRLNLGKDASAVFQAYMNSGVAESEGYRWIMDYATAYEQGRTARISLKQAVERSSLDAKTVMDAYQKGQQYAQAETEKAEERKNKARKKGVTGRKSNIDTSELTRKGITYEKMTEAERQQYDLANKIFELIGVDLKWIASDLKTDSKGQEYYSGVNGSYLNGVVTLDIHAGQNYVEALRSGVLATTGHELTHFLEQYAPKQYKALKEFVFQQIVKNSKNGELTLERMIWEKQKRSNFRISAREAEHEVIADACQEMLLDSEAIREFAAENEEAAKGMVRWLRDFFAKIKAAFKQSTELTEQARFMAGLEKDVRKAFGKLWDEALREAVKAHDEIGNIEKPQQQQNSDRDTEYLEAVENDDMETAQKMVRAAAKKAGYNSPKLYHGSSAFGFTSFNMEKSFGQIFATTSIKTAKTYSGETKLMRLSDQVKLDVDALHGDALLEAANKYLDNRYDKFKLLTDTEKKAGLQKAQNNITKLAQKAAEFRQKRADRFDAELSGIYEKMTDALNRIASAQTEDDYEAAYKQYDDALWDFKWKDGNLFSQYIWDVPSKDVLNAYRDGSDFLYQVDLYRYTDTDGKWAAYLGNGLVFDNQMALELDAELHKGVYQLYGRMGKKLTIDANGANWNAIVTPEELHLDRPSKTRTIAEKAFALGYDSVEIKNVRDNSDGTDWRGISDVYIFNAKNAVKSADPVTYDDSGNVIPLSERFNTENQDIRYSDREDQGLRDRVRDLEEQLEFAEVNDLTQAEIRKLNNELIKARGQLDSYTANQRRQAKRTSFNEILQNLKNYERVDLESLAEQISDSAWDGYEELSDEELIDALRETINERLEDFTPGEADNPKYGLFVKKPVREAAKNITMLREQGIEIDAETREVIDRWNAAHPNDERVEYDFDRESGKVFNADTMRLEERKFSERSLLESAGFTAELNDDGLIVARDSDGNVIKEVTVDHIEHSGIGALINYAAESTPFKRATISKADADVQKQAAADLVNMVLKTNDHELVWRFAGSALFSAVKSNSDGQYGTTIDFSTVCRKTQEMVTAMSEAMIQLKRGLTKDEVIELQKKILEEKGTVPCPVCYVFSRWAGVGGILDNMYKFQQKYGHEYDDPEVLQARIRELETATKTKADLRATLRQYDTIYMELAEKVENLQAANKDLNKQKPRGKAAKTADGIAKIDEINKQVKANNAIIEQSKRDMKKLEDEGAPELAWLKRVRTAEDYWETGNVPAKVLFNLDDAATFAEKYSAAWGYRTTRGPSAGKAILPYSDMQLGDLIMGPKTNRSAGTIGSAFGKVEGGQFSRDQQKLLRNALARVKAQNLIGGQRYQSTSDFRYDYGLDYLQSFWEAQALGSNMQTYTKIVEFAELVATIGGDVNLSVMPLNSGVDENGYLIFSSKTGINDEAAKKVSQMFDSAQLILVGINDKHILTALDDFSGKGGEAIGFVIPYHASGASINRFIRGLVENLDETFNESYYKDYSPIQTDSAKKIKGVKEDQVKEWMEALRENPTDPQFQGKKPTAAQRAALDKMLLAEIRQAILKHKIGSSREAATRLVEQSLDLIRGKNADITGRSFEDLRAVEKRALAGDPAAIREYSSWSAGVLWDLYNKMWVDENAEKTYGVELNTAQAHAIMPHEYWNKTVDRAHAYINGFIFRSYCYNLGLAPRFTGVDSSGKNIGYGDFSDSTGYWKTLIDRAMYDNQGRYRDQQTINVTDVTKEMLTPAYGEERWGEYKVREPQDVTARRAAEKFVAERQYSERDYDQISDLDLMDNAVEGLTEAGGEEYWNALLESAPELASDKAEIQSMAKAYREQAKKLAEAEAALEEAKRQMTPGGNRKLNTRGISGLALDIMKSIHAGDVHNKQVAKNVAQILAQAYQKALNAIDAGKEPGAVWDIVYSEGVEKAADFMLENATYSEKFSYKWVVSKLGDYLKGEDGRWSVIDAISAKVIMDWSQNRMRQRMEATKADKLIERTENRMQKQIDEAKARAKTAENRNAELEENVKFLKQKQEENAGTIEHLGERLEEARKELKESKGKSAKEQKAALDKAKRLNERLQAKKQEAAAWKTLASRNEALLNAALKSKNADIDALRIQMDRNATEAQKKQAALVQKLADQVQREKDILSGKLKPLAMQRLLKAERERAAREAEAHKDEVFQNYKERQRKGDLRQRIRNLSDEMKRRMTNPSERAYVPASLYESMTNLADLLDDVLAPKPGTKAAAKYRAMMDAIHGLAREYSAVKDMDDPTYSSEYDQEIQDAISEIEWVLERKDASWLDELTGDTKKGLRELSTGELQRIYELMRSINYSMVGATAMLGHSGFKNVFDAMRSVVDQQNGMESLNSLGKVKRWNRQRLLDNLSVMRAVEMMSGWERDAALYQLMHNIEQGTDESWSWVMDYNKSLQDLKTGKNEKEYRDALTKKLDFGVTDEEGRKVLMTKMQALQILMTAEREAHNDKLLHLQTGGAVIRDAIDLQNGKGAKSRSQTVKVTPELIRDIQNGLTDWDRAYMKAIRSYFQKEGRRTNEILYKLKHKVLQTEDYYVPYNVDANYLETRLDENQAMNMWVKTPGSTNALKQKAKQPVIIDGMDTVMARHVKEIADYIGLAIPIRDFSKVFNGRLATGEDNPLPVKKTIDRTFGAKGQHLLTQAVIDVQGGSQHQNWSSGISDFLSKLQGAFVKSALLINPSVTIKQAASYIAAESVLSHRALVAGNRALFSSDEAKSPALIAYLFSNPEGRTAKRIYNEIDQHTSLHYQRRLGMSQAEIAEQANRNGPVKRWMNGIGASMEQNALGHAVRKAGENLNPVTWIQRMDVATTAALWVACKEQAKMDLGITDSSPAAQNDEYWKHTTELYERVLRETQPMYDGLHRTAHQKQAGGLVQFLFPFRTVPIQNHGQLAASYEALKASKGKSKARQAAAKKFFAKTVWAQTESAVVFSVMTFLAALLKRKTKKYRDEDEEFTAESFAKGLMTDVGSTLFSVLQPMYGSELVSLGSRAMDKFEGSSGYTYDAFSVGVVDMINDLASSGDKLFADTGKLMRGEDVSFEDFRDHVLAMLTKGAKLAGIPADTVKTYAQGLMGNIEDIRAGRIPAINDESWDRATAVNANRFYKAWLAGDREKMRSVLSEVNSSGKSDESIANAFNARVKEAYENNEIGLEQYDDYLDKTSMFDTEKSATKIKNLVKEEFVNGERSEDDTIRVLTEICGMDGDKAWKTVQQWEAKAEHADEEEYSYSQYEDLREALDAGKSLQEAGAEYLEHGYSEKQIADAAVDHLRDRFATGEISEDEAIRLYSAYKGKDENEAWKKVQEWAAKAEHADDEDYSYSQYDAIDEAIAANKDIKSLVKELTDHGVEEKNITSHVKGYLVERYVAGGVSETALKNQLSRYLGIVAKDDVDKILNDANSKKQYGVNYSSLDEEYRAGNIKASEMKTALMKYGGLSSADADKKIRWYDLQKANPSLEISESKANTWYDGTAYTKTNGHESAKAAGMSIQDYLRAKDELAKVKGVDANNDGRTDTGSREIAYIRALTAMSWLTDRQRRALYYEEYKGTSKTSKRPW